MHDGNYRRLISQGFLSRQSGHIRNCEKFHPCISISNVSCTIQTLSRNKNMCLIISKRIFIKYPSEQSPKCLPSTHVFNVWCCDMREDVMWDVSRIGWAVERWLGTESLYLDLRKAWMFVLWLSLSRVSGTRRILLASMRALYIKLNQKIKTNGLTVLLVLY